MAPAATTTAIVGTVGAGAMPCHADELRAVMAKVGGPPVLAVGHQLDQVSLQRLVVELLEFCGVIECFTQRVGLVAVLIQKIYAHLLGPPVFVGGAATGCVVERAFGFA